MNPHDRSLQGGALLDAMRFRADPLADDTIARIVGAWAAPAELEASGAALIERHAPQWQRLQCVTRAFAGWASNGDLDRWQAPPDLPGDIAVALGDYLARARTLPDWADAARIRRAEEIFFDYGPLSCTLLFCASLPECYVVPDLAEVLHTTGQLDKHTEYRIRSTAAMVFPVMMQGGLNTPAGGGVAQVLKVRLIHATVRNLLLRAGPARAMAAFTAFGPERVAAGAAVVPPLPALRGVQNMHQALFAHGWKLGEDGLPCNQEELAYTLLTFGYVFLRGMRTLGVGLTREDEEATLHAWNVMAHLLGVDERLMVHTMADAQDWFALMQARGRTDPLTPDPRPRLGRTLMQTMADVIPLGVAKPFPALLTRELCGPATARDIGIGRDEMRVPWLSRLLFALLLGAARAVDALVRLFVREFSIVRLFTRLLGHRFISQWLMDQTRPLKLPEPVFAQVRRSVAGWGHDPRAPRWLNAVEDWFTGKGGWDAPRR
jgi:hypothetical protein